VTVIDASLVPAHQVADPNVRITRDTRDFADDQWPYYTSEASMQPPGVLTRNLPVSALPRVIEGVISKNYTDDLYYRVHVVPPTVDFGNVVGVQRRDVELWNATFEILPITRLDLDGALGLSLEFDPAFPLPNALPPLWSLQFKVVANPLGPPLIDEDIVFDVGDREILAPLLGRRIVIFPFPPNWKQSYQQTFIYQSPVLGAASRKEQRMSNWGNRPRMEFEYNLLLSGLHAQKADNLLFGWQGRIFGVIQWTDKTKLETAAAINDIVLNVDTRNRAFAVGGFVTIYQDPENNNSFQVESFTDDTITMTSPLARAWPAGTRVYPTVSGLLSGNLAGARETDNKVRFPVRFVCEPSAYANTPVGDEPPQYRGEELYLGSTNWQGGMPYSFDTDRQLYDPGVGAFRVHSPSGYSPRAYTHRWNVVSRESGATMRAFIGRREGRCHPVWVPSGVEDFTILSDVPPDATFIDVVDNLYGSMASAHEVRRDIIILSRGGAYQIARIVSTMNPSDGVLRLQFEAPLTDPIAVSDIRRISFLSLYRPTSDETTINWLTDEKGTTEMDLMPVPA
jgi:hypothetical protein